MKQSLVKLTGEPKPRLTQGWFELPRHQICIFVTVTHKKKLLEGANTSFHPRRSQGHPRPGDLYLDVNKVCAGIIVSASSVCILTGTPVGGEAKQSRQVVSRKLKDVFCPDWAWIYMARLQNEDVFGLSEYFPGHRVLLGVFSPKEEITTSNVWKIKPEKL